MLKNLKASKVVESKAKELLYQLKRLNNNLETIIEIYDKDFFEIKRKNNSKTK